MVQRGGAGERTLLVVVLEVNPSDLGRRSWVRRSSCDLCEQSRKDRACGECRSTSDLRPDISFSPRKALQSRTHLEHTPPSDALLPSLSTVPQPVQAVHQVQTALPRLESSLVNPLDEIRPLIHERLLALALFFRRQPVVLVAVLILREHLEPRIKEVSAEEGRLPGGGGRGEGDGDWSEGDEGREGCELSWALVRALGKRVGQRTRSAKGTWA